MKKEPHKRCEYCFSDNNIDFGDCTVFAVRLSSGTGSTGGYFFAGVPGVADGDLFIGEQDVLYRNRTASEDAVAGYFIDAAVWNINRTGPYVN